MLRLAAFVLLALVGGCADPVPAYVAPAPPPPPSEEVRMVDAPLVPLARCYDATTPPLGGDGYFDRMRNVSPDVAEYQVAFRNDYLSVVRFHAAGPARTRVVLWSVIRPGNPGVMGNWTLPALSGYLDACAAQLASGR